MILKSVSKNEVLKKNSIWNLKKKKIIVGFKDKG